MTETQTIDIYYHPDLIDANRVGKLEVHRAVNENIIHMTCLDQPFASDIIVAGRLLRERRTQWAINRAARRIGFQAELQLDSDQPGHMSSDPDAFDFLRYNL